MKLSIRLDKNLLFFALLVIPTHVLLAQVGIGTTTPTKDLDVNGELRIRNLPAISNPSFLASDANGNVGVVSIYTLYDVVQDVATGPVDQPVVGISTINNVNLGLSVTTTIPANKEAVIFVNYSVPVGISTFTGPVGYYGIRFLRNGIEEQSGSRKYTIYTESGGPSVKMVTVSNVYVETLTPSAVDRTFTFALNGYIEQIVAGSHTYRFNMWSNTGINFNWGFGTLSATVYVR